MEGLEKREELLKLVAQLSSSLQAD
jgi:hypothetical protein